jgi:hypothetical protein
MDMRDKNWTGRLENHPAALSSGRESSQDGSGEEVEMEIMIAVAIYIVGVAVEGLIADRAQKAQDEGLVLARLARIAGQRELA